MSLASRERLTQLIEPVVEGLGYELLGIELQATARHALLRLYIDHGEGIRLADCERVSRQVSALLDVEDPIDVAYDLEVSSPGLDRPLFRARDFRRFAGRRARLRLSEPLDGRRNFSGVLLGLEGEDVRIEVDGEAVVLPLALIDKARLVPE